MDQKVALLNYNVFEVVECADDCDRVYDTEEFVCAFEKEEDAQEFARVNTCERIYNKYPTLRRGTYKVYPGYFIPHSLYKKEMEPHALLAAVTAPTVDPEETGYGIFTVTNCCTIIPGAQHIEKMDFMHKFRDDYTAARQAEKDGIPIIHDMEGVEDWTYIDTPENRALITAVFHKYPECDTRNWRKRASN